MATKKPLFKSANKPSSGILSWLGIAAIVVLLDQVTKIAILKTFHVYESRAVTSFFDLVLVFNPGAAFNFLGQQDGWQRYLFTGIAIAAVVYIVHLLRRHTDQRLFCWAISLIMGGAIGNVIDRLAHGKVVDFLSFHYASWSFPAFNVADSAITIGVMLFILDELRRVNKK